MDRSQAAATKTLKQRKKFMLNCLCKNDVAFKEYYDKIEEANKKFEKKMNDKLKKIKNKIETEIKKETEGLKQKDKGKKIDISYNIFMKNVKDIDKIVNEKLNYGLKSNEKLIKSPKYKSALKKSNRVCHNNILKYKNELETNLKFVYDLLEFYKQKRKTDKSSDIEMYYTKIIKMIDILEKELKLLNSVLSY